MSDLSCIDERFDVVFSSLAVHYIKDFNSFIAGVYGLLVDGGIFMFSQEDLPSKKFSSLSRRRK
jgi:predicted TPR repeat methyltransferase